MGPPVDLVRCNQLVADKPSRPATFGCASFRNRRRQPMTDRIERELWLPAAPDAVWEAVTERRLAGRPTCVLDLRPGRRRPFDSRRPRPERLGRGRRRRRDAAAPSGGRSDDEPASRVELTDRASATPAPACASSRRARSRCSTSSACRCPAPAARRSGPRSWRRERVPPGPAADDRAGAVFGALSDPTRRALLAAIAEHPPRPRPSSPPSCRSPARRWSST